MLHDVLTTEDLMNRYHCERQKAADIMHKLPSFKIGNRLFVKAAYVAEMEEGLTVYPVTRSKAVKPSSNATIPRRRV